MPRAPAQISPATDPSAVVDDDDHVVVGYIQGAWGLRGEVKVVAQSSDAAALLHARRWHLVQDRAPAPRSSSVRDVKARRHGSGVVARIEGVEDRDAALALTGAQVRVARAEFPRTADDEYYWVDLIGCRVVNRQGEALGDVVGLVDTGVHSVLRIQAADATVAERLVPFVAAYVDDVDLAARTIRVDWGLDY
jgi:16S rRNA processing protein RimM